jgi:hypothetical protein
MKKTLATLGVSLIFFSGCGSTLHLNDFSYANSSTSSRTPSSTPPASQKTKVILDVPFITEVADNKWTGAWKNACEEASIVMVEQFYLGMKPHNRAAAEKIMLELFAWENQNLGHNANSDAAETARIINEYSSFSAIIKREPTLSDIKDELRAGRPVISLHNGFELNNPHIPFLASGSGYHMMVIVGFDDEKKEFIVNDDGWEGGLDSRYPYATIMAKSLISPPPKP